MFIKKSLLLPQTNKVFYPFFNLTSIQLIDRPDEFAELTAFDLFQNNLKSMLWRKTFQIPALQTNLPWAY